MVNPGGEAKSTVGEIKLKSHEARNVKRNIEHINKNLKIISEGGGKGLDSLLMVNPDPGGKQLKRGRLGDSTDSLFSGNDSLISFGSTGSYNSAGFKTS